MAAIKRTIWIIGCGMGGWDTLTGEAQKAILNCDCMIGAPRLLPGKGPAAQFPCLRNEEIMEALRAHPEYLIVGILVSGDPGFFSAAKELSKNLAEEDVHVICGVSSLSYFCAKLKVSWEDANIISVHGRTGNVAGAVDAQEKTFILTGGSRDAAWVIGELCENGLGRTELFVGENLGIPYENISHGRADELKGREFAPLSVVLAVNRCAVRAASTGIPDGEFLRADTPMTKFEVRCVSIAKLGIRRGDIVYDIGAGTGAVSVEMARLASPGRVYAIEKDPVAIKLLGKNREKFHVYNLTVVDACAPEGLAALPSPDCVFIGGSSGNMTEIFGAVLHKNPAVSIVVNVITLETLTQAQECFHKHDMEPDVTQIIASHVRQAGGYHMMTGGNPVFILSGKGGGNGI